jgi:hypothetical protein
MSGYRSARGVGSHVVAGILCIAGLAPGAALAQDCNRACLTSLMTQFIDALVAHDPSGLPLADDVRYTEDSRLAELGAGIWQSVTANGGFRQDYIDTREQIAAAHVLLLDGSETKRLAHHRSRRRNDYNYQPKASVSRDGSRVVFASNHNLQSILGYPTEYSDAFLIMLGASTGGTTPPPPPPSRIRTSSTSSIRARPTTERHSW